MVGQSESKVKRNREKFNESNQEVKNYDIRTRSKCRSISNNFPNDDGNTTSQPISIKSKVAKVGRNDLPFEQSRSTKSQDQVLSGMESVNRNESRSQVSQTSKTNETDKPAAKRMKTRSQTKRLI